MRGNYAEIMEALLKTCFSASSRPLACVAGVTGADLKQRVVGIRTGAGSAADELGKEGAAGSRCSMCSCRAGGAGAGEGGAAADAGGDPGSAEAAVFATRSMLAEEATLAKRESAEAQPAAVLATTWPSADDMSPSGAEVATIRPGDPNDGRRRSAQQVDDQYYIAVCRVIEHDCAIRVCVGLQRWQCRVGHRSQVGVNSDTFDIHAKVDAAYMADTG